MMHLLELVVVSQVTFVLLPLERHFRGLTVIEEVTLVSVRDKEQDETVVVVLLLLFFVDVVCGVIN